jgi:hypothetical protein
VADLRQLLASVDVFSLKKEYHLVGMEDGTQRFAKVEASGKRKSVYCDNSFPPPFEKIRAFVNDRIIVAHVSEISAAKEIHLEAKDMEPESFD